MGCGGERGSKLADCERERTDDGGGTGGGTGGGGIRMLRSINQSSSQSKKWGSDEKQSESMVGSSVARGYADVIGLALIDFSPGQ